MANVRTLKYKLYVKNENKDEIWAYLRELQTATRSASNYLYSLYYLRDTALPPSDIHPATQGYRECRDKFPALPSTVAAKLSNTIFALYRKERKDIFAGRRGLRAYHDGLPIPERKTQVAIHRDPAGAIEIVWNTVVKGKVHLGVVLGRDRGNYSKNLVGAMNVKRAGLARIACGVSIAGESLAHEPTEANEEDSPFGAVGSAGISRHGNHGDLSFAIDDHDLYALIPVHDEPKSPDLDPSVSVGVDLGIAIPAVCAVSNSPERAYIGDRDDFLRIRMHLQSAKRRLQRNLRSTKGGHGRRKKLAPLERVEGKERNFVRQYNHMVSSRVVDFALKARAATIKLEYLEGYGSENRSSFILRNWSYYELQTYIEYKAKRYGIKVLKIDPYHTSQTCSACAHYEEGQRQDQATFVCKSCGERLNADYNAARNIARSTKIVEKREQCEYWRRQASGQPIMGLKGEGPQALSLGEPLTRLPARANLQLTTTAGAQNARATVEEMRHAQNTQIVLATKRFAATRSQPAGAWET